MADLTQRMSALSLRGVRHVKSCDQCGDDFDLYIYEGRPVLLSYGGERHKIKDVQWYHAGTCQTMMCTLPLHTCSIDLDHEHAHRIQTCMS